MVSLLLVSPDLERKVDMVSLVEVLTTNHKVIRVYMVLLVERNMGDMFLLVVAVAAELELVVVAMIRRAIWVCRCCMDHLVYSLGSMAGMADLELLASLVSVRTAHMAELVSLVLSLEILQQEQRVHTTLGHMVLPQMSILQQAQRGRMDFLAWVRDFLGPL